MAASLILEAFAPLMRTYWRIEEAQAKLERFEPGSLMYKITLVSLTEAEKEFERLLDREIDMRIDEILTVARGEIAHAQEERNQARPMPQLVAAVSV